MTSTPFNPLNGTELKTYLLAEISRQIDNSGLLRAHLAYPYVTWSADLKLHIQPAMSKEEPAVVIEAGGDIKAIDATPDETKPVEELELSIGPAIIDTPDLAREVSAQPIPTAAPSSTGHIVDAPVMSANSPTIEDELNKLMKEEGNPDLVEARVGRRPLVAKTRAAGPEAIDLNQRKSKPKAEDLAAVLGE